MKRRSVFIGNWVGLVASFILVASPLASAATPAPAPANNAGQALEIAPPVLTLSVNPGQTVKTKINLRDISTTNLIVTGQVNDFLAAGEDGTPKIILQDDTNNPFSMKSWVGQLPSLTLIPRQIKTLDVTINVPKDAAPGGHYGVIRFTATPPDLHSTGVSLSASLGALMLVTVSGNINDNLSVKEFSTNTNGKATSFFESAPVGFTVRLQNTGNVQEQPTGHITVKDMFGKLVANVNVNIPPHYVLPASIRKFNPQLDSTTIGNRKLFGHYHATLNLTYGSAKKPITGSLSFWVIPYKLVAGIIVLLIAAFFILRFLIGRYNSSIINRANSRRP